MSHQCLRQDGVVLDLYDCLILAYSILELILITAPFTDTHFDQCCVKVIGYHVYNNQITILYINVMDFHMAIIICRSCLDVFYT